MAKKQAKKADKAPASAQSQSQAAQLKTFFEESQVEIKKVTWPSRKEVVTTSIAVLVFTLVSALYLGLLDLGLSKIVESILS